MRIVETLLIALDSLLRHKTRALLTMLGIIIGVAAVIATVAVGQGASVAVDTQIASLGTNVLIIFPASRSVGGVSTGAGAAVTLTLDDMEAIRDGAGDVAAISPTARTQRQVVAGNLNWFTSVQGGNTEFFRIRDWTIASGEPFTEQDERTGTKVCLLGKTVADNLFPGDDPVGQTVRIAKLPFRVVGVLAPKGQNAMGQDQDDLIIAPFSTVQRKLLGIDFVNMFVLSAASKDRIASAQSQVEEILRARHRIVPGDEDDFTIRNQSDIAATANATTGIMTTLIGSIASISLIVGGIGIMNIMLVSVTERTREIGIRIAIGARRRDILQQFLIESILLSVIGGLVGVGVGLGLSEIISRIFGWPVFISLVSVALAFLVSAAIGIIFGSYPASKAAGLSPIDALRYE